MLELRREMRLQPKFLSRMNHAVLAPFRAQPGASACVGGARGMTPWDLGVSNASAEINAQIMFPLVYTAAGCWAPKY